MKNRFQNVPLKRNLHRYIMVAVRVMNAVGAVQVENSVDP
jgi:hypothetical protein